MAVLLALVTFMASGAPMAFAVTRRLELTALLAPLAAGLQCTMAAFLMLVVGGSFGAWLVIVTLAVWAFAALLITRPRPSLPPLQAVDLVTMYAPLLLPALLVRRPPVAWDARAIWWFHASWIEAGSQPLREALGNPALAYSHPDYPPFASASVAGAWTSPGGSGLWVAQVVTTVLTLSAVAWLGYTVRHLVPDARPMVARLAALGVMLGLWTLAGYGVAAGYVDHLWAAALAACTALLFLDGSILDAHGKSRTANGRLAIAVLLATVAALTKNEGLVATAIVAVLFTIRARRELRVAGWVWLPVGCGLAWSLAVKHFGADSDLTSSPRVGQLLSGDSEPFSRIPSTISTFVAHIGWLLVGSILVSLIAVATQRRQRAELGLSPLIWPWLVMAGFSLSLIATYAISPYEISWHLATSSDRVSIFLVLVLLATTASCVLVASVPNNAELKRQAGDLASTKVRSHQRPKRAIVHSKNYRLPSGR